MKKIVIIGGGISGFTSAINAKTNNNEVIILEGQDKAYLIYGGYNNKNIYLVVLGGSYWT